MKASALALLGTSLVVATACDSSRTAVENTSTAANTVENTASTEPVSFTRELTQGDARFEVRTTGSSAQRQLTVRSYRGAALTSDPIRLDINGAVRDAVTADLNGNGKPELYIFTDNAAANGGFYGYEFAERGYTPISSPGMITGTAGVGYSGKDSYVVSNGSLTRSFPVTTTTADANATTPAAASSRTITYRLGADGKWTMGQVMDGQP
ncbi:hypothetical protein [Hymenobacter psychrotolerans]|uniref:FG-GAP repeat-containing protein n=1 Tax=Hymenobacter psychrotolerans DSM 18569 TaxID=1121959 RepID=A0A1M6T0W4_9BACT|nr:hypothetical protein [Hymenobacter psychrotolerans]SHK50549.1 hypothetical protein SAMN02746009_01042 [Hymenobacter psychrotolerans DSM 18569]